MTSPSPSAREILEEYAKFQRNFNEVDNEGWNNRTSEALAALEADITSKIFIDVPTAWEITRTVKTHEINCSWEQAQMMCDCSVLDGAQLAIYYVRTAIAAYFKGGGNNE